MTPRLVGWLLLAAALVGAGGWGGYRAGQNSRNAEVRQLTLERDTAARDRDTARGQVAAQQSAAVALAEAADAHARKLAADAARAREAARQAAIGPTEVLRDVPVESDACKAALGLLDRYARAARAARGVPDVPAEPAKPAAPGSGAVRDAGAGGAGAADGVAAE